MSDRKDAWVHGEDLPVKENDLVRNGQGAGPFVHEDCLLEVSVPSTVKEEKTMVILGAFVVPHPPLIVPEIGRGMETKIQSTIDAYKEVARRIAMLRPDTIVLSTPHAAGYADYIHISPNLHAEGTFRDFGVPEVRIAVDYDVEFASLLETLAGKAQISAGTLGERESALDHGTMVPLYFINQAYRDYKLVRIANSALSPIAHYRFGKCIAEAVERSGKRVVMVASGDLSHRLKEDGPYGLSAEGAVFDREATEAMARGDFLRFLSFDEGYCEAVAECGLHSFQILAGTLDGKAVASELLSYEGPFGVGYAVASFEVIGEDDSRRFDEKAEAEESARLEGNKAEEDHFVRLARASLENFVRTGKYVSRPEGLPAELTGKRAGVFVSLKMEGRLRGCIGTISPTSGSIAEEIIHNAVSAGTEDPRFPPVQVHELPALEYSVDVLGEAERIASIEELETSRYGIIVTSKGRKGLLLPNLPGVDTPQQQVSIALEKAGIPSGRPYDMERFEVIRHK